ncbi:MAG: hypothetical protein IIA17_04765 [candidate division Zixibacteria bacterium]|nr:hypothetical protein [candidate division Zixibacteria bacterium]
MKRLVFLATFVFVVLAQIGSNQNAYGQNGEVYLSKAATGFGSSVDSASSRNTIAWTMAMRNNRGVTMIVHANGFRIYSPSGASWTLPVIDTLDIASNTGFGWGTRMDGGTYLEHYTTGSGADTVAIGGFSISGEGFEDGFDADAFTITIPYPGIDSSFVGGTICLDSSFYFVNQWLWGYTSGPPAIPDWSGPHCYTIVVSCCLGGRGDLNNDGRDATILDLTYLVDILFRGGESASCDVEADLNGDDVIANILDLTYLVDFIFRGGPAPNPC